MCSLWQVVQAIVCLSASSAVAQVAPFEIQPNTWNSSFSLSLQQIKHGQITDEIARSVEVATNSDRSQLAYGGPGEDDFYTLPPLTNQSGPLEPGILLKVQPCTNMFGYSIPPNTGLSRFMYTTSTFNGTVVPATAFILWPFEPRRIVKGHERYNVRSEGNDTAAPTILWAHGTSGFHADGAPSAMRNLWYGFNAPFTMALEGYAVVGPDFAGLGIDRSWDGSHIAHQYNMAPAGARDSLYALQAAWEAFPTRLTKEFVVAGHSQGGGVAWGVAECIKLEQSRFPRRLFGGYKGAIAGSPVVDVFGVNPPFISNFVGIGMSSVFPDFTLDLWLTPLGLARNKLWTELKGGIGAAQQLFLTGRVTKENYTERSWYASAYGKLANPGRKDFAGPLLVLQGTNDVYTPYQNAKPVIDDTCDMFPHSDLEWLVVNGTGHVPTLLATQSRWLQWIEDRFRERPIQKLGCHTSKLSSWLPFKQYLAVGSHVDQWAGSTKYNYQDPLGL